MLSSALENSELAMLMLHAAIETQIERGSSSYNLRCRISVRIILV